MKKFALYIIAVIIALQLATATISYAASANTPSANTASANTTMLATENTMLAAENTLLTPKPTYLPGPTVATQEKSKGVREWIVTTILPSWTTMLIGFVGVTAFLMLIISGVRYLTAYGNEEAGTSAKKMIIFSLVGLLLALFSYTIVRIIINLKFL